MRQRAGGVGAGALEPAVAHRHRVGVVAQRARARGLVAPARAAKGQAERAQVQRRTPRRRSATCAAACGMGAGRCLSIASMKAAPHA